MRTTDPPRDRSGVLSLLGVWVTFAGFGLLTFDASLGVLAIPAGIVLALAAMPSPRRRSSR